MNSFVQPGKRIPVHIISGFLGAGKTTFLNHLIRNRRSERLMVIENEMGDVNIDGALVVEDVTALYELTAGCLCCSLNDELIETLAELAERKDQFDRLLIETTGIADPGAVAQTILGDPYIERHFELKNTICLADARHWDDALRDTDEARRQILAADILLLNKTDLVEPEKARKIQEMLQAINPLALTLSGQHGVFDLDTVLDVTTLEDAGAQAQADRVPDSHAHLHHDITSFTLLYDTPFDLQKLGHEMLVLLNIHRHQVYRVKGIVEVEQSPLKVVIQSVRNTLGLADGTPWQPDESRQSKIVFIGKGVHRESIERILNRCLIEPAKPLTRPQFSAKPSSDAKVDPKNIKFS